MGARRADWADKTTKLLRPGTPYFQIVFTLPDKLSSLVLGNRKILYRQLFHSAASALDRSIREECGMQPASMMVLHTWNQRLEHHPHLHALVPGCGPSLDGTRWISCRQTKGTRRKPPKPFLVDNKKLGWRFRDHFVRGVRRLLESGDIEVEDEAGLNEILDQVSVSDWVVYIQPPPKDISNPADVVKYLARYMTGGPISDRRLIEVKGERVHFLARSRDKSGRQVRESLPVLEFIWRWTLHILPKGFTKVRYFGGWSPTLRGTYGNRCNDLNPPSLPVMPRSEFPLGPIPDADQVSEFIVTCPHCQAAMELESYEHRPSWSELFYGPDHPRWLEWMGSG